MERESLRAGLNAPPLIGLLSRLALLDGPSTKPSFVHGLGQWLSWADAIGLSAALQPPPPPPAPSRRAATALEREFEQVHTTLLQRIADDAADARRGAAARGDDGAAPQRRRYTALQQAMRSGIEPLRARARAAAAHASPELRRLAALDALLESALAAREQALLALLPTLVEQHHERLRRTAAPRAERWQQVFRHDMHSLLCAELDLRLLPVRGLIGALRGVPPDDDE